MIKNIETMTANEYLKMVVANGAVLTDTVRAGERIEFSPNAITVKGITENGMGVPYTPKYLS